MQPSIVATVNDAVMPGIQYGGGMNRNWDGYGHMMWGGMGWWSILFWLLILVGIVALLALLMRRNRREGPGPSRLDPMDIARERYARGEITREEFEQIKHDLRS